MNQVSSLEPYEKELMVNPSDIDQLHHVNNVVYLRWVQDIAVEHWLRSATKEQKKNLLWVVAKHEIEYKRPAMESDELLIRTWVGKARGRQFERYTEIVRKSDGKQIAKVLSLWAPVDIHNKRPIRAGQDVYEMFSH
jgi:acyl-CoA thioester hydrolase